MAPNRTLVLLLIVCLSGGSVIAANREVSFYASASGSSSVGMLGRYTNQGLGGTFAAGTRPFESSGDIVLEASVHYDRFGNTHSGMGSYSFTRLGGGLRLYLDPARSNRTYLMVNVGPALVRVDRNSGFPPYRGKSHNSTNLYGGGGIGYELGAGKPIGVFMQAELVDILDTLFGDYRFVKLSLGLRL